MRPIRLRLKAIAAWLGVVALGFNALVPVHLAFDLSHTVAPYPRHPNVHSDRDFVRSLLTLLIGNDEDQDQPASGNGHQHSHCAVCGAIGTLAAFAPAAVSPLLAPTSVYAATLTVASAPTPLSAPPFAYRARAPPVI